MSFGAFLNGVAEGLETGVRLSDTIGVAKERKAKRDATRKAREAGMDPGAKPPTWGGRLRSWFDGKKRPAAVVGAVGVPPQAPPASLVDPRVVADNGVIPGRPFSRPRFTA